MPPHADSPKAAAKLLAQLSTALKPLVELERKLGNTILKVYRWGGDGPIIVSFIRALHFDELQKAAGTKAARVDCWDPHYTVEACLVCAATKDSLAGPPPICDAIRPFLQELMRDLVAGDIDSIVARSEGHFSAESMREALRRMNLKQVMPPAEVFEWALGPGYSMLPSPEEKRCWYVELFIWTGEPPARTPVRFHLTFTQPPRGAPHMVVEDFANTFMVEDYDVAVSKEIISARHILNTALRMERRKAKGVSKKTKSTPRGTKRKR